MTYEMMQEMVRELGADVSVRCDDAERVLYVTIHDDDLQDAGAVVRFEDMLDDECVDCSGDCYMYYDFSDFTVVVGSDSLDD